MKNRYEVRGDVTAIFINGKGNEIETLIDTVDLNKLLESNISWFAHWSNFTKSYYAKGHEYLGKNSKKRQQQYILSRFLLGEPIGHVIDHFNNDTLDNRRKNLRELTRAQNAQNRNGNTSHNTSGYRGVSFDKATGKFKAYVRIDGKLKNLGRFIRVEEAAEVAKQARSEMMPYSKEYAAQCK